MSDLEAIDTKGEISGKFLMGSPVAPMGFVEWLWDSQTILIPLTPNVDSRSTIIGAYEISPEAVIPYWGDADCKQYIAVSMFEKYNTAVRLSADQSKSASIVYDVFILDPSDVIPATTTYYTMDRYGKPSGPQVSEVPINFIKVDGIMASLTGDFRFIITAADATNELPD